MSSSVLALGLAAYFLGDDRYAAHARKILSTWFLDPATRMNPSLEYGQAVRGINTGRGTGLIDTVPLIHATQGIVLLELAGKLDEPLKNGLRQWYSDVLHWMTTSEKGLDEKNSGNNHATWWTAQVAAYATANGTAAQKAAWNHYRTVLVPGQIQTDGSCPREEARTQSLSYSTFNLDAFSVLCRIAEFNGVDLWKFHTPQGISLDKALAYLTPYVERAGHVEEATNHALRKKRGYLSGMGGARTRVGRFDARVSRLATFQISLGGICRSNRPGTFQLEYEVAQCRFAATGLYLILSRADDRFSSSASGN